MAYTSGRAVKSSKTPRPTTVVSATRDARRLVTRCLPVVEGITVNSSLTADPHTLAAQVRTTITFPETIDASDLANDVQGLSGYVSSTWSTVAITVIRTV
jgi:hypothetical protein